MALGPAVLQRSARASEVVSLLETRAERMVVAKYAGSVVTALRQASHLSSSWAYARLHALETQQPEPSNHPLR